MNFLQKYRKMFSWAWISSKIVNNFLTRWCYSRRFITLFSVDREQGLNIEAKLPFKMNSMEDLFSFEETETWHNYDRFLARSREWLHEGNICFTLAENKRLLFIAWVSMDCSESRFGYVNQVVQYGGNKVATSFAGYVNPRARGRGIFTEGLKFFIRHTFENSDSELLFAATEGSSIAASKAHIKAGFEKICVLRTVTLFGLSSYSIKASKNSNNFELISNGENSWVLVKGD